MHSNAARSPKRLAKLSAPQWAWLHFKLAVLLWSLFYAFNTPTATVEALWVVIRYVWLGSSAAGALLSAVGIVMSAQLTDRIRKRGVRIEVGGLFLMMVGPLVYVFTQVSLTIAGAPVSGGLDSPIVRLGSAGLGYIAVAALVARLVIVWPRYRRNSIPGSLYDRSPQ